MKSYFKEKLHSVGKLTKGFRTMQKKSEFDFLRFAAHLRFCLILVRICS